jgi:hypothetical protein
VTSASHTSRRPASPAAPTDQAMLAGSAEAHSVSAPHPAWWTGALVAGAALVALGSAAGLWYLPFVAGLLFGLATRYARPGFALSASGVLLLGPLAWGAVLAVLTVEGAAIGATARIAAAIAGLPASAVLMIVLTLLLALLQTVTGLWLGRAVAPGSWPVRREIKEENSLVKNDNSAASG